MWTLLDLPIQELQEKLTAQEKVVWYSMPTMTGFTAHVQFWGAGTVIIHGKNEGWP